MGRSLMHSISSLITPGFELEESPRIISVELLRLKDQSTVIFPACGLEKIARTAHKKVSVFRMTKLDSDYDESDELRQSTPLQRRIELFPGRISAEKRGLSLYKIIIPAPAHDEAQGQNSYAMSNTLESISLDFVKEVSVVLKSGGDQLPEVKLEACCDCPVSQSFGPLLIPFINPPVHQLPLFSPPSIADKQLTSSSTHLLSSNKKLSDQRTLTSSSSVRSSETSMPSSSKSTKKPKGILTKHTIRETAGLAMSPDSQQKSDERSSVNRQLVVDVAAARPPVKSTVETKDKDPIQAYVKRQVEHLAATAETKEERELACFIRDECIVTADFIQDTIEAEALAMAYQEHKKKILASSKLGPDGSQNDGEAAAAAAQEEAVKEMEVESGQQEGGPTTITIEATVTERIEVRPPSTFSPPAPPLFPPGAEHALEARASPLCEIEPYAGLDPLSPQLSQPLDGRLMSPGAEDGEGYRAKDGLIAFSKDELDIIIRMGLRSVGDMTMGFSIADVLSFAFLLLL
jgi:hypothetical protein